MAWSGLAPRQTRGRQGEASLLRTCNGAGCTELMWAVGQGQAQTGGGADLATASNLEVGTDTV